MGKGVDMSINRGGVELHPKYGLNPTVTTCFYCGEPSGILLVGREVGKFKEAGVDVRDDGEMPMNIGVVDKRPCPECEKLMKMGVMLIRVRDGEEGDNPYRTGRMVVVKDEYVIRVLDEAIAKEMIEKRVAFVPETAWKMLGLPTEDTESNSP